MGYDNIPYITKERIIMKLEINDTFTIGYFAKKHNKRILERESGQNFLESGFLKVAINF